MATYDVFNTAHKARTQFDRVLVQNFMQWVVTWEAGTHYLKEICSKFGLHTPAVWGVIPYDLAASILAFPTCRWGILQLDIITRSN